MNKLKLSWHVFSVAPCSRCDFFLWITPRCVNEWSPWMLKSAACWTFSSVRCDIWWRGSWRASLQLGLKVWNLFHFLAEKMGDCIGRDRGKRVKRQRERERDTVMWAIYHLRNQREGRQGHNGQVVIPILPSEDENCFVGKTLLL